MMLKSRAHQDRTLDTFCVGNCILTCSFFVNIQQIPPVLRWLRYFSTLGYTLEALSINEVGSGLQIIVSRIVSAETLQSCSMAWAVSSSHLPLDIVFLSLGVNANLTTRTT